MFPLIAALLFALPLVVLPGNNDVSALPQTALLETAVPLLWVIRLIRNPLRFGVASWVWPLVASLLWASVSLAWAVDPSPGLEIVWRWSAALALAVLIAGEVRDSLRARALMGATFAAACVVSGLALLQHLAGFEAMPQAYPPAGTLANKNVAAGFVAALLPFGVVSAWAAARTATSLGFAVASGLSFAFVVHADCRGAQVGLALQALAALCLLSHRSVAPFWTTARLRAAAVGAGLAIALSVIPSFEARQTRDPAGDPIAGVHSVAAEQRGAWSVFARLGIWRNTVEMIRERPLAGVGLGAFPLVYPRFSRAAASDGATLRDRVESAHNDYLQALAEFGVPGLAFLALGLWAIVRLAGIALADSAALDPVAAAAILGGIGLLAQAAFSPTFTQPALLAAAAVFVGSIAGLAARVPDPAPMAHAPGPSGRRAAGLALTAAAFVAMSVVGARRIVADRHHLAMVEASARGDWARAAREGLEARRAYPARADIRFGAGEALLRLGRNREAATVLAELVAADPWNVNALGNLAIAHERLGEAGRAAALYGRVRRLRPDDGGARDGLLRLAASGALATEELP